MNATDSKDKKSIPAFVFRRGLGRTLLTWFLALSLVPLIAVSYISYESAKRSLHGSAEKALSSIANLKTRAIDTYFNEIFTDLELQSQLNANAYFLETLTRTFKESGKSLRQFTTGVKWTGLVEEMGDDLKMYRKTFGHHDIFLIDTEGNILFTAAEEEDTGINLFNGPLADSLLARACRKSLTGGRPAFSDYQFYAPSGSGDVFGFCASVILNDSGRKLGLIVAQFPLHHIDRIMRATLELGKTAEIYLVGPDLKMRSNSIIQREKTVLKDIVDTAQTRLWKHYREENTGGDAARHSAFIYKGPHGKQVLGIHRDIDIKGIHFGVIAEIEEKEAFAASRGLYGIVIGLLVLTGILVVFIAVFISRRIVNPIRTLSSSAKQAAGGDLEHEIRVTAKNEIGELADSFNNMLRGLRKTMEENTAQNRLMTGQADLNLKMRGEPDIHTLGANIISYLARHLGVQIGAIYIDDEEDRHKLKMIGSFAYNRRKNLANQYMPGEGLVGQAALEKKHILISNCPGDYITIHSGLGESLPRHILVYPFLMNEKLKGVLELGSLNPFPDFSINFLDRVAESIAIALHSVSSRNRTASLLEKTQRQAEELRTQQEELRQANEELEEHAEALKSSEEKLQAQQEELRQTNEELEEQTERLETQKRDIENKNRDLEKARRLVEEKARDLETTGKYKSEFLANMSHELRTPLNSILLLSRLMADNKDHGLSPDHVESAQSIYSSGSELLELINEVLDLSKVESGKMELFIENVTLRDISNSMERHFKPLAEEKKLKWNVEISHDLPDVIRTDRQRAEQIIKNFLSNAFKFTESGGVTMRIHHPEDRPGNTIAFSVIDTGIGIPEDKRKLIFGAFQQADGTTNRQFGGTGLGLSISRKFSKLLNGEIQMTSNRDKGTTFTLYLPYTLEKAPAHNLSPKAGPPPTGPVPPVPPPGDLHIEPPAPSKQLESIEDDRKLVSPDDKSILVIEDDPVFVKVLRDLAHDHGFKCLIAGDGETGLHFADFYKPSAILLDIGLPRLSGWAVMSRLKDNPATRHIPVHFVTAADKQIEALKMGAVDYITKPVSPEMLDKVYDKLNQVIFKKVKDLLVVEDNKEQAKAIAKLIGNHDVRVTIASTASEAHEQLLSSSFDCMVLDLGLPDMSGVDLLDKTRNNDSVRRIPIIVYTGRDLSIEEKGIIDKYAESTIIKGAESHQRLLDETTLFLHRVEKNLPKDQQKMLRLLHDKEAVLAGKNILIVDDDMRNVFSLKKVLTQKGINVRVGKNGREGIDVLNDNPDTDLVIMDIMMPEMNGYEAMEKIRKQERFKDLPLIALTAKAMKGDRAKCIEAGASDYLAKPVDTDRLFSVLRVWLY